MTDTLKYSNSLLVSKFYLLSECCCDHATGVFWESVPCPINTDPRNGICSEWEQCQFGQRVFVQYDATCDGVIRICEAQRLRIGGIATMTDPTVYTDVIYFQFTGVGVTGDVVWDGTNVTISSTGLPDIVISLANKTVSDVISEMGSETTTNHPGRWSISLLNGDFSGVSSYSIATASLHFLNGTIEYLDSKTSGLYLEWNGNIIYVAPSTNVNTFKANLETALQTTIGAGIDVVRNEYMEGTYFGSFIVDIIFADALCGITQPEITTYANVCPGTTTAWTYHDSDPNDSYLNPSAGSKEYYIAGTGTWCPYEDTYGYGPAYYNGTQCSPQKGLLMGANQPILPEVTGYCIESCIGNGSLDNLENTYLHNTDCYSMTKSFFLFGMDGRPKNDYYNDKALHVTSDCNYPDSCASSVPCNCAVELFIPMWHKNITWGPFGSYYKDIELAPHPAWEEPYSTTANPYGHGYQSFLSSGYPGAPRSGWDYRPYGFIETVGEWTETKEINIYFYAFRPIPFAVGDDEFDDLDQYIAIDETTISPNLNVSYSAGNGCGPIQIGFNCSGKTIGDYVDAINNLRTSGISALSGCTIFEFCVGSTDARSIPASRIMNTSAEVFESNVGGFNGDALGNPYGDSSNLRSGSHIVMPKEYNKYFSNSLSLADDLGVVTQYYQPITPGPNAVASTPPFCRALTYHVPKDNVDYGVAVRGNSMWWTTMPLCKTNVVSIGLNPLEPSVDPQFTEAWVKVTTGRLLLYASGMHVATTGIDTVPNSEFTVSDLIAELAGATFTWASGSYTPFTGVTDLPNECWLSDVTSIDAGTYSYSTINPTTYNFSYKEPLLDLVQTNIGTAAYASLYSNTRRLCYWGATAENDPWLPPCLPTDATVINGTTLNCEGDNVIAGSWRIAYGCTSPNCLTQWFIPAGRCTAETVQRCTDGNITSYPHPFNQARPNLNDAYWAQAGYPDTSVYQPLLYVCEYDFHPDCDIPCMVKVPFAVVHNGVLIGFQNGGEVSMPGKVEFCDVTAPIYSNNQGWCQYFDPTAQKVRLDEIPRDDLPYAFIAGRTAGAFCSTHPWNFDPRITKKNTVPSSLMVPMGSTYSYFNFPDGCVDTGDPGYADAIDCSAPTYFCFSCDGWDKICNLGVVYGNFIDYMNDPTTLCALFRPIIQDTTAEDVCAGNSYGCNRIDIDCSTVCAECGFSCDTDANCLDSKNNGYYTQSITYSKTSNSYTYAVGMNGCEAQVNGSNPACLGYAPGVCVSSMPGTCPKPICVNQGYLSESFSVSLSYNLSPCGCDLVPVCEDHVYAYTSDCGYSLTCGDPGCVTFTASPNPSPTPECFDCNSNLGCLILDNGTTVTSGTVSFDEGCVGLPGWGIAYDYIFTETSTFSETTPDPCDGMYTCSYTRSTDQNYVITGGDSECLNPATINPPTSAESGGYSIGHRDWSTCDDTTTTPTPQTIDYIFGWESSHGFVCGYAGLFLSGSGQNDLRFFGPYCLGA